MDTLDRRVAEAGSRAPASIDARCSLDGAIPKLDGASFARFEASAPLDLWESKTRWEPVCVEVYIAATAAAPSAVAVLAGGG
jgi:hypothetical protein